LAPAIYYFNIFMLLKEKLIEGKNTSLRGQGAIFNKEQYLIKRKY